MTREQFKALHRLCRGGQISVSLAEQLAVQHLVGFRQHISGYGARLLPTNRGADIAGFSLWEIARRCKIAGQYVA